MPMRLVGLETNEEYLELGGGRPIRSNDGMGARHEVGEDEEEEEKEDHEGDEDEDEDEMQETDETRQ